MNKTIKSTNEFLKLYRNILRCHRVLQEPMKSMGDQYVKMEWRLHKNVDSKIATIFYNQWNEYHTFLTSQRESILDQVMENTNNNNRDNSENNKNISSPSFIGKEMNEQQIKALNKKQLDQLNLLKSETTTIYKSDEDTTTATTNTSNKKE